MACSPVRQRVNQRGGRGLTKVFAAECCKKKNSVPFLFFFTVVWASSMNCWVFRCLHGVNDAQQGGRTKEMFAFKQVPNVYGTRTFGLITSLTYKISLVNVVNWQKKTNKKFCPSITRLWVLSVPWHRYKCALFRHKEWYLNHYNQVLRASRVLTFPFITVYLPVGYQGAVAGKLWLLTFLNCVLGMRLASSIPLLHHSSLRQGGKNTVDTPSTDAARLCNTHPSTRHDTSCASALQVCEMSAVNKWSRQGQLTPQIPRYDATRHLFETQLATCVCVSLSACVCACIFICFFNGTVLPQMRLKPAVCTWDVSRHTTAPSSVLSRLDDAVSSLPL